MLAKTLHVFPSHSICTVQEPLNYSLSHYYSVQSLFCKSKHGINYILGQKKEQLKRNWQKKSK